MSHDQTLTAPTSNQADQAVNTLATSSRQATAMAQVRRQARSLLARTLSYPLFRPALVGNTAWRIHNRLVHWGTR